MYNCTNSPNVHNLCFSNVCACLTTTEVSVHLVLFCSCGCPPLEKVWEADLEACHLFLRGLQLRTPSYSGPDSEERPRAAPATVGPLYPQMQTSTKEEEEEDCAMLTALGGRWCPEANLQHSEFTKVRTRTLFGLVSCFSPRQNKPRLPVHD